VDHCALARLAFTNAAAFAEFAILVRVASGMESQPAITAAKSGSILATAPDSAPLSEGCFPKCLSALVFASEDSSPLGVTSLDAR